MKKQHQLLFYWANRPDLHLSVKSNSKHVVVLKMMHGNEKKECIIHAILLLFKWIGCILITSSSHPRLMEIFHNSRVSTVMFCLHHCEQMETDSDSIGQLPIIDRPASAVLQDSSADSRCIDGEYPHHSFSAGEWWTHLRSPSCPLSAIENGFAVLQCFMFGPVRFLVSVTSSFPV